MPPHLHPRSAATSTLFAGTLLASFIVVGIPHVFPCPRPRRGYADSERQLDEQGKPIRRQRKVTKESEKNEEAEYSILGPKKAMQTKSVEEEAALFRQLQQEAELLDREARECPVPKPRGMLGRLLGFEDRNADPKMDQKS